MTNVCPVNDTHALGIQRGYGVVCVDCGVSLAGLRTLLDLPVLVDGGSQIVAGSDQPLVRSDVVGGMAMLSVRAALQAVYGTPGPLGTRR
jgi:hypothetical protein